MRASLLTFLLISGFARISFAWGAEGHRAIAALAQELISPRTQIKVQQLLNESGDRDLAAASTWADQVRENSHSDRIRPKDAEAFNRQFPNNPRWHFVDLPLGTNSLAEEARFIEGQDDVVHAIERCIALLEQDASVSGDLSRTLALRLLVHFVGDIHQPLHCGTGFYRLSDIKPPVLVTDPEEVSGLPNDRGGNDLFYGPREELHALWDTGLVAEIADSFDSRSLEAFLKREYAPFLSPATSGDYHRWAETWALESVKVANAAYAGIRFNSFETMGPENQLWISITLPPGYHQKSSVLAAQQLTKAAVRLAQLLDQIRWPQVN
jgi:S1/P1 Nuclease